MGWTQFMVLLMVAAVSVTLANATDPDKGHMPTYVEHESRSGYEQRFPYVMASGTPSFFGVNTVCNMAAFTLIGLVYRLMNN